MYHGLFTRSAIHQCALARDLTLFDAGDHTEVGERGLTLSGGQKVRDNTNIKQQVNVLLLIRYRAGSCDFGESNLLLGRDHYP